MKPNRKWEYTIFILVALALKLSLTPSMTSVNAQSSKDVPNINQLTVAQVRSYVQERAIEKGVDPVKALWVIDHESEDCWQEGYYDPKLSGDDGISIGCWQFNIEAHPDLSVSCIQNFYCSTDLALDWMAGKDKESINAWSTWRFRFKWFSKQNPPHE